MEPVAFDDIPLEIFLEDIMDLTRLFPEDFPAEFAKMAARIGVEKQHLFITDFIEDTREHVVEHYLGYKEILDEELKKTDEFLNFLKELKKNIE